MGTSNQVIPATRVGVFAQQNALLGTASVAGFIPTPCIIGETFGNDTILQDQAIVRGNNPSVEDLLGYDTVERILGVSDVQGGVPNYTNNVDYQLDTSTNPDSIDWLGTVLPAPTSFAGQAVNVTPTVPRTGLAANTYFYVITAIKLIVVPSTNGETTKSVETSVVVGGGLPATNATQLTWAPVPNAIGYKIYRSLVSGAYTNTLIATVLGGATNGFLDDGYTPGAGTPPVSNNAFNRPADGATYYVTYEAILFNHFVPQLYFSLNDLIAANGLGSDVTIAGTLMLGGTGVGQGCSQVMVVTIPDGTEASYIQALTAIENSDVQYVVPLSGDLAVQLDTANHCVERSSTLGAHPRIGLMGSPRNTPIGDPNTPGTLVFSARRLVIIDGDGVPQGRRVEYISNSSIQMNVTQADGQPVSVTLDGWFLAAAVAGVICALPDAATSATFQQIQGLLSLNQDFSDPQRDFLQQNGLLTCFTDTGAIIKVYQDRTLDLNIIENQERCIVSARDQIFRDLLKFFKNYVGRKITPKFLASLASGTIDVLENEQKNSIIESYSKQSVVASQNPLNPRQVIVTFTWGPLFPANQIVFQDAFNV